MLYFDNASTTKISKSALDTYTKSSELFYNPSALYLPAVKVSKELENARNFFLKYFNADKGSTFIFTGCATESNNSVLKSAITRKDKKYIFSAGEHSSVHNTAKYYQELGYNVVFIPLKSNGSIDISKLECELDDSVALVSCIHVSNETGAINDIKEIVRMVKSRCRNALVHADGVQAVGKIKIDLTDLGVDYYTISAHKIHGPKGIGALYIKNINKFKPFIIGGEQEKGLRAGTENIPAILSFKTALEELKIKDYTKLKETIISNLNCDYKLVSTDNCVSNIISICFKGVRAETIQHMLEGYDILIGTGSACNSKAGLNRVVSQLVPREYAQGAIRLSFEDVTIEECKQVAEELSSAVNQYIKRIK